MMLSEKGSYFFQNFLKGVSNFNDQLLWNLFTVDVKKHITGKIQNTVTK